MKSNINYHILIRIDIDIIYRKKIKFKNTNNSRNHAQDPDFC